MKKSIANRVKQQRKLFKFSQEEVANKLFITQAAYSLIENGVNSLAVEHVIRLSKLYGITTDYLLIGECANSQTKISKII